MAKRICPICSQAACDCGTERYELVAEKRRWVPECVFWLACGRVPTIQLKQLVMCQPFRWLLTREP